MMLSTINLNSSISKENSGQINGLPMKNKTTTSTAPLNLPTSTSSLQPGSLSHLKQKLYGSGSSSSSTGERKALGEITNTTSKLNNLNGKKSSSSSSSSSSSTLGSFSLSSSTSTDNKLLFVPTSNTPQIRKKKTTITTSTPLPSISNNSSVVAKVKKPTLSNTLDNSPLHNNNTIHSAPPAPLRLSTKFSNQSIESLIMTPSYDIPISGYTESFEENIYKFEQNNDYNSDDHSLMIEDNFSFSDFYNQDIVL